MCEIFCFDGSIDNMDLLFTAKDSFESNPHGLGALAVHNDGERFTYETWAQADPDWRDFLAFVEEQREEAWRIVVHTRLATTGDHTDTNTHPLTVGETGSDTERTPQYIIHNGVVTNHSTLRTDFEAQGHEYATDVDSETIAHAVGDIPMDTDTIINDINGHDFGLEGRLNYIVCTEAGIFVRNDGKYELSEDFTMATCRRRMDHFDGEAYKNKWMVFKPSLEHERVYIPDRRRYSSSFSSRRSTSGSGTGNRSTDEEEGSSEDTGNDFLGMANNFRPNFDDRFVSVYEDEFGKILTPDERVPLNAEEMYVADDGAWVSWWMGEGDITGGSRPAYVAGESKPEDDEDDYDIDLSDSLDEPRDDRITLFSGMAIVYEDELGRSFKPDDRVPDDAEEMLVKDDGSKITWWNYNGDKPMYGQVPAQLKESVTGVEPPEEDEMFEEDEQQTYLVPTEGNEDEYWQGHYSEADD